MSIFKNTRRMNLRIYFSMFVAAWKRHYNRNSAKRALNAQFERVTGHPTYLASNDEADAFIASGLTPHQWLSRTPEMLEDIA